jgi:hypothetical protein
MRRLLLIAAIVALLAAGAAIVGSQVLQRWLAELPPITQATKPPAFPSQPPSSRPLPSSPPAVTLAGEPLDASSLDFGASSLAVGPGGFVAAGGRTCPGTAGEPPCFASLWRSDDGRAWTQIPRSSVLELGPVDIALRSNGPDTGVVDIAAGPGGYVAIGISYEHPGSLATVWTSSDGATWTAVPGGPLWETARLRAVAAIDSRWIIVGETFLQDGPRAAIWTSVDLATWTRIADGPIFDIGGYREAIRDREAGGISDVAVRGDDVVAVGSQCDGSGGQCQTAIWTSPDALTWTLSDTGRYGALRTVAAGEQGFVALGWLCDVPTCAWGGDRPGGFGSLDGTEWEVVELDVGVENDGVAESAGGGAGFVAFIESGDEAVVEVLGSTDGRTWGPIPGALQLTGVAHIRAVGGTAMADGSLMIVGSAEIETADSYVLEPFLLRIFDGG